MTLFEKGERARAESVCRGLLARNGSDTAAMGLLGVILAQTGRIAEAAELFGRIAERSPRDAVAHGNHGSALRDLGRHVTALACYDRALVLRPDYAEAHYNRGLTLQDLGKFADALSSYDRAIELEPDHASAWNNRGTALRHLGRVEEAVSSYSRAIDIRPDHAEAHNNRGVALYELGRFVQALASYDRAIELKAAYPEAHHNRGVALHKLVRLEEALASFERALALRPEYPEALNSRGIVLKDLERYEEALASHDRAIELCRDYIEAYCNRGAVLRHLKRYAEALGSFQRAIDLHPRCVEGYRNQGATFIDLKSFNAALESYERALAISRDVASYMALGSVLVQLRRTEEAVESYRSALALDPDAGFLIGTSRHTRMQICDWDEFDSDVAAITAGLEADRQVSRPFNVLSLVDSPRLQRRASEIAVQAEIVPRRKLPPLARLPRHERIRIGYLSADLRNHAVSILTAELFETHDRSRFEIIALSLGPNVRDEFRTRIEPAFDRFLWVGAHSDHEVAELARRLQIDILVDLGGYTGDARPRIVALRCAPVQASYLGYLGTMGGEFMDYLIADPIIVPAEARAHYSEKIAYLPSYQVNDSKRPIAERNFTRAELGLPPAGFVYCCFNASYKINPEGFESWMRILRAVPDGVLLLLGGDPAKERNLRREAEARGIAAHRLVFGGRLGNAEYLARYRAADLFLDTHPYNAGTTASDALWAGLPVLTFMGESFAARVAASVLTAAGLPDLVAPDRAAYERLAVELALDPTRIDALKRRLAANRARCALFDTPTFTRNLEALYTRMYERHHAGLPPEHLEIE